MNHFVKTEGIIIGKRDFAEADKLLIFLTPDLGKITVKAKGLKKILAKMSGHLELFNQVKIDLVKGKSFFIVTGAQAIDSFSGLKKDFEKMSILYYMTELINHLTPENYLQKNIYHHLLQSIKDLNRCDINIHILVLSFEMKLLKDLGYRPELTSCVGCSCKISADNFSINIQKGGVVCGKCAAKDFQTKDLSINALKTIRLVMDYDYDAVSKITIDNTITYEVKTITDLLIEQHLGRRLKSRSFLKFSLS